MRNTFFALAAIGLGLAGGELAATEAKAVVYDLAFSDPTTGGNGVGSFDWDASTQTMTGLQWTIDGKSGGVFDSALAASYQSWSPVAATYGLLYYNFFTRPQETLVLVGGLTSWDVGLMPSKTYGDFGFVAFGAEKTSAEAKYRFFDTDWNVVSEGYVSAAVPEPATWLLLLAGGAALVLVRGGRRLARADAVA